MIVGTGTIVNVLAVIIGAFIGEAMDIENKIEAFGELLKQKFSTGNDSKFILCGFCFYFWYWCKSVFWREI